MENKISQEKRISLWNTRCNNVSMERGSPERKQSLLNQLLRLEEEVKEVREAIELGDDDNLAQEIADVLVVTHGLTFLSRLPVSEVFERKADNNDLKYTKDYGFAVESVEYLGGNDNYNIQSVKMIEDLRFDSIETFYTVHRNYDNKICKLKNHPTIDCSDLTKVV